MKLYHWTLNAEKILQSGFRDRNSRNTDTKNGVWFTDQLLSPGDGIRKDMRLITIEIPDVYIEQYEEKNEGTEYRAFSIPDEVVNRCKMSWPVVYMDRGICKINEPQ